MVEQENMRESIKRLPAEARSVSKQNWALVQAFSKQNRAKLFPKPETPFKGQRLTGREWLFIATIVILVAALLFDVHLIEFSRSLSAGTIDFFQVVTRYGKSDWILIPCAIILVLSLFVNWRRIGRNQRVKLLRWLSAVGFTFTSVASIGLFVAILKRVIGRARPRHFDELGSTYFNPFSDASFASFPSGHATTTGAFCMALLILKPKWWPPILVFGVLVSFSRVFIGAHYLSDIIAGALLGSVGTWFIAQRFINAGLANPNKQIAWRLPTSDEWRLKHLLNFVQRR